MRDTSGNYTLYFSQRKGVQLVKRQVEVRVDSMGEAMRYGKKIADDSKGAWLFVKAELIPARIVHKLKAERWQGTQPVFGVATLVVTPGAPQ